MSNPAERLAAALSDRYAIARELGQGGMATVYLAEDLKHDRKVALKVLKPELAVLLGKDRFLREIRVAARLNHPHILPLLDSGAAGETLYYTMPFVAGASLADRIRTEGPLGIDEIRAIVTDVASALDYAHQQGIVHRDLKPDNVLLHHGKPMIADFGIALVLSQVGTARLTETGLSVGTPQYMSPEQVSGDRAVDGRSDVYALGCVVYEMVVGDPPFTGRTAQAVMARQVTDPAPPIRTVRRDVPATVDAAVTKALAKVPGDRFASAGLFASALAADEGAKPARHVESVGLPSDDRPTVAVLPFANVGQDPQNAYFADGVWEDVIANLSRVDGLRAISRTSCLRFRDTSKSMREVGEELGAGMILEGSVRRAADRVRVVVRLVDAKGDEQRWAETYDRELTDIFAIQSEVALSVATALRATLTSGERERLAQRPTDDLAAYDLYLLGRHHLNKRTDENLRQAIGHFESALALDPRFVSAHAGLAEAHLFVGMGYAAMPSREALPKAKAAAARAIELDPASAEAHATHGFVRLVCDWDADGATAELRQAIALNPDRPEPHQWLAWCQVAFGEIAAGRDSWQRALEVDPLSAVVINENGWPYSYTRLDEQALEWYRRAIEIDPTLALAHYNAGWALHRLGRLDEAIPAYERGVELSGGAPFMRAFLATALTDAGRTEEARRILDDLLGRAAHAHGMGLSIAVAAEALGEQELALDWLDRALEERDPFLFTLPLDDAWMTFASLRDHPRFRALLDRIGIGKSLPSNYQARERAKILARSGPSTGLDGAPPKPPVAAPVLPRRTVLPAALGAFLLVAIGITTVVLLRADAGAALDPERVVVQVFRNGTADPSFEELGAAAGHWIAQGLQRAGMVQVVPWETSLQSWRFVEEEVNAGRVRDPLRAFAEETGAGTVISGAYYLDGGSLQFQTDVIEVARGVSRVALDPVRGSASEPMRVVEALRRRVLGSLAVTFDDRLAPFVSSDAPPPTLEASRAFQRGIELYLDYAWLDATNQFLEAARIDSTFRTALVYAASSADIGGEGVLADSLTAELLRRRTALSPVEAYVVDAASAASRGDYAGRIRALERAVALAPESYWTYRYARELKQANRQSRAIEVLTTQLQPEKGAMRGWAAYWAVLANAYHLLGDHEAELGIAREAHDLYPDRLQHVLTLLEALGAHGRLEEAMALWRESAALPPDWGGSAGVVLVRGGQAFAAHGHPEASRQMFETAVDWFAGLQPEEGATVNTTRWHATALSEAGRLNEAQELLERLDAQSPNTRSELGIIAAKRGDREEAMRISEWLAGLDTPGVRRRSLWRGMIAAQLGDREEAVRLIRVYYDEAGFDTWTLHHSAFDSLRSYLPFQEMIRPRN